MRGKGAAQLRTSEVDHAVPRKELGNLKAPLTKWECKLQVMSPPFSSWFPVSFLVCFGVEKNYEGRPQKAAWGAVSTKYILLSCELL